MGLPVRRAHEGLASHVLSAPWCEKHRRDEGVESPRRPGMSGTARVSTPGTTGGVQRLRPAAGESGLCTGSLLRDYPKERGGTFWLAHRDDVIEHQAESGVPK